ncbi:sugar kinase [candidate division KSB1 bacterium]|nr:sugar kinase [candidate division KSB1 bacterium]RQW00156.1 MAG: sugar kinase [candidate division KSB1 bacterium]
MSLLVVGSMAYDAVETPFDNIKEALGGSAMFFASAASYFTAVNLVAVVGDDFNLDDINFLRHKNVNLDGLLIEKGETFRWGGRYLDNMIDRETLYTKLGVFETFKPVLPEHYKNSTFIFLANIQPDLQYNIVQQIDKPKFVAMDTMNFWITGTTEQLKKTLAVVDCLIINDSEVRLLSGENNIFVGARVIQNMGPQTLIVKKGEHGSILIHNNAYFICPAVPVEQLYDPTGAGDTFAGGFMGYLAMADDLAEINLRRAVVTGTVMASFCVESFSADRLKSLQESEIRERITRLLNLIKVEPDNHWLTTSERVLV